MHLTTTRLPLTLPVILATVGMLPGTTHAQCDTPMELEVETLLASDPDTNDQFGYSVAVSGDRAIVGARLKDDYGTYSGAAYVFRLTSSGWVQEQKLLAEDGAAWDQFGNAVAIDGNLAVVGSYLDDDNGGSSGSAYVFRRLASGVWIQEAKLVATNGATADLFGNSVSISANRVIVGANEADNGAWNAGAVYIFQYSNGTWIENQMLTPADPSSGKQFGISVSIDGNRAVVGAFYDTAGGMGAGAAYVFRNTAAGWVQEFKLIAEDPNALDLFGSSVAIGGDVVVVGSPEDDDLGTACGSAYVFRRYGTTWSQEQKLHGSGTSAWDKFGNAVAVNGNRIVVGAFWDDPSGTDSGAAYLFEYGGTDWGQTELLAAPAGSAGGALGGTVSVSDQVIAAGAPLADDADTDAGNACLFTMTGGSPSGGPDCNGNGIGDACDIEQGTSADVNGNGLPDECETIGDVDGDGDIDVNDLVALITAWGVCPTTCPGDLDGDGLVGIGDLMLLIESW